MRFGKRAGTAVALAAFGLAAQGAHAAPSTITALTDGNDLVTVGADKPNKALSTVAITGLGAGESIAGIDRRPNGGSLYAVIDGPMVDRVAALSDAGVLAVGFPLSTALAGSSFGVDFNPTVDRLRINSDADQNLRVNVGTGATTVDSALNYAGGADPAVVGAAYTNNDNDAISPAVGTATQLFDIDTATDTLALQNPPNAGTLTTRGLLGFVVGGPVGFDIYSEVTGTTATTNELYASFAESNGTEKLYTVDLLTGAATEVGPFARKDVADIAVPIDSTP